VLHDRSTNGKEVIDARTTPAHTGTTKTGFELFGFGFDDARPDQKTLFAVLHVIHAPFVIFEKGSASSTLKIQVL